MKIQKEAAEELYERVKTENQRVFQSFEEQLKYAAKENETSQIKIAELEHQIHLMRQTSEDYALEKNHLVEKLYEKERSLKDKKDNLAKSQKEYTALKVFQFVVLFSVLAIRFTLLYLLLS